MNDFTWFVDSQVIPVHIMNQIREACSRLNFHLTEFNLSESPIFPDFPSTKFIPYGSTHLIKHCQQFTNDNCGLFFNEENFTTKIWIEKLNTKMLNHDAQFCALSDVLSLNLPNRFFIKPDSDLKSFTGSVVNKEGIERFYNKVKNKEFNFDLSIPIVVNSCKNTGWEWRLVMIKDEVIASSSYKLKNMLNLSKRVPEEVINYAQEAAKLWHPADVFVMDVGESDEGLKIVEFNCFNASGFYNCDVSNVISRVTQVVTFPK